MKLCRGCFVALWDLNQRHIRFAVTINLLAEMGESVAYRLFEVRLASSGRFAVEVGAAKHADGPLRQLNGTAESVVQLLVRG